MSFPKETVDVSKLNVDYKNLPVERKAELFDAMMNQERIRVIGWAQLGNKNYQHIGMEWWTTHLDVDPALQKTVDQNKQVLVKYLETFADKDK